MSCTREGLLANATLVWLYRLAIARQRSRKREKAQTRRGWGGGGSPGGGLPVGSLGSKILARVWRCVEVTRTLSCAVTLGGVGLFEPKESCREDTARKD